MCHSTIRRDPAPLRARPRKRSSSIAVALLLTLVIFGCGKKGDPLPPQSYAPVAARDFSLHQQGSVLILKLSYPQTTSAGTVLPGLQAVELWDYALPPGADPSSITPVVFVRSAEQLSRIEGAELSSSIVGNTLQVRIALEEARKDDSIHLMAVRTISTTGDVSEPSNLVALQLSDPPEAPGSLELSALSEGIEITWMASSDEESSTDASLDGFHVYRKTASQRTYSDPITRVDAEDMSVVDETAVFGERYFYTIRAVASLEPLVESDAAVEREIDYQDVFAPQPPVAVTALSEGQSVRLIIDPSPDTDVEGYVIFRREPGSETYRRLNDSPFEALEYIDRGLASGLTYEYRVSAVDNAGNQGDPGASVSVTLR